MKRKKKRPPTAAARLRQRAEAKLRETEAPPAEPATDPEELDAHRLVHELQVHQLELQMQNEELHAARIEAEAGLARYTELFDFAPIGYAVLNPDETIREVNHSGALLLGKQRSALAGVSFGWLIEGGHRQAFDELIDRALGEEGRHTTEVELVPAACGRRLLSLTACSITWPQKLILLTFEDITEQRSREERLTHSETALRGAERRKDEFLAVLSHELRNPLNSIRASTYLYKQVSPGSEKARKAITIIDRQVGHLTRLVDDLLDVTRITRGKVRLKVSVVDLADLVRRAMDDYAASFEADGIELQGRLDVGPFWINADPARVSQSMSNVLANANKFTPRMGRVVVSLRCEGTRVVLRIRDTGIGISADVLPHLFEPFTQAPQSLDRARGGLGIGLAMTSGLVELQGGTVTIQSEGLGRGTEVTIAFPLAQTPAERERIVEPPRAPPRRILIIEDHLDSGVALCEALRAAGHSVEWAQTGRTGLQLARALRPEIVVCDLGLPGMDGYAVARALRADADLKGVWLVALTGYAHPEDIQHAREAGFDEHMAKPIDPEALERSLAAASRA